MDGHLSLDEIDFGILELAFQEDSFEVHHFLDLKENRVVVIGDRIDDPGEENLQKKIENDTEDRFVQVPRGDTNEAWQDMRRYAFTLNDDDLSERLLDAIQGKGAFRQFKRIVQEEGFRRDWQAFKNRRVRRRILDWLLARDLITEDQSETSMENLEQTIEERHQRQRDLENMTQGSTVECIDPAEYPGLSAGTRYSVIGHRPEDNLIKVADDRDKQCWYPKSQFELIRDEE